MKENKNKHYQVSSGRKVLYYFGMVITGVGFLLFISTFLKGFMMVGSFNTGGVFLEGIVAAPIGIVLIAVGQFMMHIGKAGLAGSGVILDPQKAREDLEPFSRQGGGMLHDALEEVESLPVSETKEVIKVRCPQCKALNEEDSVFCKKCGQRL